MSQFCDYRVSPSGQRLRIENYVVSVTANNALAHHASAHGGLSANGLSDICLSFFERILSSCLKLCLTVEHSIL